MARIRAYAVRGIGAIAIAHASSSDGMARHASVTVGADAWLPNMATEAFLGCLSKAALNETALASEVGRYERAKDTRAALDRTDCSFSPDGAVQGRGALRRELTACLRTGRALRVPRARTRGRGKSHVGPEVMISERPVEAEDRAVPGHWEGDLILGLGSSAVGTLVERTTRFTMLLHLPRMPGHGEGCRAKNGPALAGHGVEAVRDAITRTITTLPEALRRSLTWDQGVEITEHPRLRIDTGLQVYFCDPHSPWQRGTNENTNGLLRQYFPKGTDLAAHSADDLAAVAGRARPVVPTFGVSPPCSRSWPRSSQSRPTARRDRPHAPIPSALPAAAPQVKTGSTSSSS